MLFNFSRKNPKKELENLQKAFDILNERYQKKTITLEEFTKQCDDLTKKINKYKKLVNKD